MSKSKNEIIAYICIITIGLAGLIHLFIAPAHYEHAPAHGIFFAVAGLIQFGWAIAFWRRPSKALYQLGLGLSGGLVVLWFLTLILGAPFGGHSLGDIDTSTVVCKVSELVALISLVALAVQGGQLAVMGKLSMPRRIGEALLVSMIVGLGFYGLGKAAEPIFPQWQHAHVEAGAEHGAPDHEMEHGEHDHEMEHEH